MKTVKGNLTILALCSRGKTDPRRGELSPGVRLGLAALAARVQPDTYVVTGHSRRQRHKETYDDTGHHAHLLSVARLEQGSAFIIPAFDHARKGWGGPGGTPQPMIL